MKPKTSARVFLGSLAGFALASILYFDQQNVYNVVRRISSKQEQTTLNRSLAENNNAVLITLYSHTTILNDLCNSLRSLENVVGSPEAPVIIFYSTDEITDAKQ